MPTTALAALERLEDLTQLLRTVEGFGALVASLQAGRSGTVDGAWGSSAALAAAALGQEAPSTLLIVLAHPRDTDAWAEDVASFAGARPALFPAWENVPTADTVVDNLAAQRLRMLKRLQGPEPPRFLLTTMQALIQPVPDLERLRQGRRIVRAGDQIDMDELARWLVDRGYQPADAVELPGEFSRRGGILDVFSPDADAPYRLEFFGDEVDSLRQFAPHTQRSLGQLPAVEMTAANVEHWTPAGGDDGRADGPRLAGHLGDYLPAGAWVVLVEPEELQEQGKLYLERVPDVRGLFSVAGTFQQLLRRPSVTVTALPSSSVEATCHLHVESVERFSGDVSRVRDELDTVAQARADGGGDRVLIACHNEAEVKRLGEVLAAGRLAQSDRLRLVTGRVRAGFRMVFRSAPGRRAGRDGESVVVLGGQELFHRDTQALPVPGGGGRPAGPRRRLESRAIDSFLDLNASDLVVHVSHGIARFHGMQVLEKNGQTEEHLILEFRDGVHLYVPASKIDLVQKYVGGSHTEPELSKLGGTGWLRKKEKVQAAVLDLASEMVELQALREAKPGVAFPPDTEWQAEFEAAFPYQETPDQLTSLAEIKLDMERPRPMDRLICGDVGYGKTELAIRAAFKAIDNGRQVAVLVPTTVLAEQHFRTFGQRLAEYPFVVECISRFRTAREQRDILQRLAAGGVDVIIGTHRLVSSDVRFKDLGLAVIDEEQRFGVEHKERLKRLRQTVDVLTMTATPIPRTLHLALLGIRDISNLETAPADRLAIETRITRFDPQLIRHAILRELNRDGQVYFVHNRVYNIHQVANQVREIVPEARVAVAHGQMPEHELEAAMLSFVRRESDVLVATTIIESGLDIPNANTIFINQADNYGLADLHQLRGRVGRYKHRAYAYLLLDSDRSVTPNAARRLKAIEEFTELGAGFKIALRDLEIRGAGNILGTQQSGHIAAVGYEMYCQLLENAVRSLKNQRLKTPLDVTLDLPWEAYLPRDYVPGQRPRIEVYRRLARVRRLEKLTDFRQELRDRFGPVPEKAEWLLRLAEVRLLAARWQVAQVRLEKVQGEYGPIDLVLHYRSPRHIQRLADRSDGRLRVIDEQTAYFRLSRAEAEPEALYASLHDLLRAPRD
jgi:transcription-repair coupling factor (superfamily II helicase)